MIASTVLKLEMPDLASANEVSAMDEAEEKRKKPQQFFSFPSSSAFLAADNGQMPQLGERRREGQDKLIWRDLDQFLPVGDRAKVEEIRSLYGVSGSYASCKPNRNFIYLQCSSLQKYKCSYILRWRKADGLVQAKGEHCHKDFILPRMEPRPRYKPNKCRFGWLIRECPFETDQIALMREHYGQFHTDKLYFHCHHCPANFTRLFDCKKHILGHEKANQQGDGKAAEWQLEEDMEEDPNDNLADLRSIFADAIADELRKERLRLAAGMTSASSSAVNQHLINPPPPQLNPVTGFEMAAEQSWWDSPYERTIHRHGGEW